MSKRRKMVGFVLVALVLGLITVLASRSREPSYGGRTLGAWLKDYSDAALDEVQRRSRCEEAVRAIGPEESVPHLLMMARKEDGPIRSWIIRKNEKWNIRCLKLTDAPTAQQFGIAGFEILGTNCWKAVPQLTSLMQDTNHAFTALRCLVGIGAPAEMALCQALTNQSPEIRRFATSQLAEVTDDIGLYVARLEGPLNDPDATVRFAAVQALGLQTEYPEEVIPLLVKAMGDSQQSVSSYAAKFLGDFGTNGAAAFGALSNVVVSGNMYMASHALRSLMAIAPERGLPMTVAWLRCENAERRARAAWVLGEVGAASPEIVALLRSRLDDQTFKVAGAADTALRRLRDRKRAAGKAVAVAISGEPSCGGKTLREWLQTRDGVDLSSEARRAIREIGTNAVPALLQMLTYRDPEFGVRDYDLASEAVMGFGTLGKDGAPALPKLEEIIAGRETQLALYALNAAASTGVKNFAVLNSLRMRWESERAEPGE